MAFLQIPPNKIGLTKFNYWSDMQPNKDLREQLQDRGIEFSEIPITHLVGMAGNAALVFYISPVSGKPVTVLAVPIRYEIDSFAEEYYIFEGMTKEQALRDEEWWLIAYDAARHLVREEERK